jgi:iron complex transport system permease protein
MSPKPDAHTGLWATLIVLTIGTVCVTPFIGTQAIDPGMILRYTSHHLEFDIFWRLRVPRTCMAFLAGMALSASGMAFQAMFRNPLATPFTLGVSGGASLGSALCIRLGLAFTFLGIGSHVLCAFGGALLTIFLVYSLTRVKQGFSCSTLIAPAEMPVGVITALLGGPFFLWLLMRGGLNDSSFFNKN